MSKPSAAELSDSLKGVSAFVFQFGCDWMVDAVEEAISRLNRYRRGGAKRKYQVSPARLERMIRDGKTYKQISEALGIPVSSIGRFVRTFGLCHLKPLKKVAVPDSIAPREWTPEEDDKLRALWARGDSATDIACQMGDRTRNMVIGRVHRLGLPSRSSPIKRAA